MEKYIVKSTPNKVLVDKVVDTFRKVDALDKAQEDIESKTIDKIHTIDTYYNSSPNQLNTDETGITWDESFSLQYGETEHTGTIFHQIPLVAGDNVSFDVEENAVRINTATPNEIYVGDGVMPDEATIQIITDDASYESTDIPSYWENHLTGKIASIKTLQDEGGKDCFSFIVMTDMHYEQNLGKLAPRLARKIADECDVKYVLILGDCGTRNGILKDLTYIDDEWNAIEKMIAPIRDRLLITDGNHDGSYGATDGDGDGAIDDVHGPGNSAFNWTPQKKYNRIKRKVSLIDGVTFDESGCGYYADDKVAKVRYIILSTHNNKYEENEDGSSKYSNMTNFRYGQSQFDLVIDALNTLEEDWSVIVASHVPLDRSGELKAWGATETEDNFLKSGEVECWLMADVLNAFVNRETCTGSFTGTQGIAGYKNLADKNSADWLEGYVTTSSTDSKVTPDESCAVTNFVGDGKTELIGKTIYYKNAEAKMSRLLFYNANKEFLFSLYPNVTNFPEISGFTDGVTEGHVTVIDTEMLYGAVYVRLCLASGTEDPIITIDEPIKDSEPINLVNMTEDIDGDGVADWVVGRLGSSGNVTTDTTKLRVTNYIPYTPDQIIKFQNLTFSDANRRFATYKRDENGNFVQIKLGQYSACPVTTDEVGICYFDTNNISSYWDPEYQGEFIRFTVEPVEGKEPIIYIDEKPIGECFDAVSVDADFTNANGTLVGYFGGHLHKDGQWGTTYNWGGRLKQCDFWTITTRCDGRNENETALSSERVKGTDTEQSFDVFTVNKAIGKIHATKIGAGEDRVIDY